MKLIRYGEPGKEKPGVIINDDYFDVSEFVQDYNEDFFDKNGLSKLESLVENNQLKQVAINVRLGCPIARPSKIVCVGLNYVDHAQETNSPIPKEPILFFKSTTAIVGPNDNLIIPKGSEKTDWEVELAIVISKKASYISLEEAEDYIAGYCLANDYSERAFQMERNGQWTKGKGCDSFAPIGPYLATKDEIAEIGNLRLWLKVNGKLVQDGNTANLIFNVPTIVAYISQFMTLLPGDIIFTGTPAGVGIGQKPHPWYLKPGDEIELGIDGLGSSKQIAVAYK